MRAVRDLQPSKSRTARRGEKEAISLKRRRKLKSVMSVVSAISICVAFIGAIYLWRSGTVGDWVNNAEGKVGETLVDAGLVVDAIKIVGEEVVSEEVIIDAAQIKIGEPILAVDIEGVIDRIEQLKWVNTVAVRREYSGGIVINVLEHKPAALWQVDNKLWIVSDEGVQIDDENLEYFTYLPMISGIGAEAELEKLLAAVSTNTDLFDRVETASWVGGRRWDLYLKNGIKIMLPEEELTTAWQSLAEFEQQEQLLARNILAVDFRVKDKTVVRLTPQEAARRRLLAKTSGKGENI